MYVLYTIGYTSNHSISLKCKESDVAKVFLHWHLTGWQTKAWIKITSILSQQTGQGFR